MKTEKENALFVLMCAMGCYWLLPDDFVVGGHQLATVKRL